MLQTQLPFQVHLPFPYFINCINQIIYLIFFFFILFWINHLLVSISTLRMVSVLPRTGWRLLLFPVERWGLAGSSHWWECSVEISGLSIDCKVIRQTGQVDCFLSHSSMQERWKLWLHFGMIRNTSFSWYSPKQIEHLQKNNNNNNKTTINFIFFYLFTKEFKQ